MNPNQQWKLLLAQQKKGKARKYGNKPQVQDGVRYDSKGELAYKGRLDLLVAAGELLRYEYHVRVPLEVNGVIISHYEIDFVLYYPDGRQEWVDVKTKSTVTRAFRLKAKHVKAQYGIDIILIDSKTFQPIKK